MTLNYYNQHADDFFTTTVDVDMSSLYAPFLTAIPPGGHILDAGCGSGRDTKAFHLLGYQVDAFDASPEMVLRATNHCGLAVQLMTFSQLNAQNTFDGIWCCASLLHVPFNELTGTLSRLAQALKPNGVCYASFKYGDSERVKEGRHFTDINEHRLEQLIQPLGILQIIHQWQTEDKRPGRSDFWLNALLKKYPVNPSLP